MRYNNKVCKKIEEIRILGEKEERRK